MIFPLSQNPPSSSAAFRKSSAARARSGVGAAEPMPVLTVRVSGCSAIPNAQTAMTMALRVPTLENCCGPSAFLMWTRLISSSGSSALRFTPVKNSSTGMRRVPRTDSASTSAPADSSAGCESPAGEAAPRFPPTEPRLRIWGDPTVWAASARPGSSARRWSMIRVYGTEAPSCTVSSPTSHSPSSPIRFRSRRYSGRRWSKLISTMTSVPPAMGTAVGYSALAASASSQLAGRRKSMRLTSSNRVVRWGGRRPAPDWSF